ncbi:major facilitator superfamily domain-containing protein [Phyllosticta capitalensis]|uniref:major facilitator superfamily domain-containing protein n=1 Tax=Phyllosticta capitalensis TaxID=121624 RepID=UPI003132485B
MDIEEQKARALREFRAPPPPDPPTLEKKPSPEDNIVGWNGPNDPENPQNFPRAKKWVITLSLSMITFCITFASSVFSTATFVAAREFHVSTEVMTLGTSLFVLGFCVGPPIWGPLSEILGRRPPLFFAFFVFAIFQIPVAVAHNIETVMLCRFFAGVFGSSPLAIVGGTLVDFWNPIDRGIAVSVFAGAVFLGPCAGPIGGSFTVANKDLGWRWTLWITMFLSFFFLIIGVICIPETHHNTLLTARAGRLRRETGNWALHAKAEEAPLDMGAIAKNVLVKPFVMLLKEPILFLVTIYMTIVYGILYLTFEAFPIAFTEKRGWSPTIASLTFAAVTVGVLVGVFIVVLISKTRVQRIYKEKGRIPPEERLIPMMIGSVVFPAGLFMFAWTSNPHILWVPQVIAGGLIGLGLFLVFLQGLVYIIDVYLMHANSALAGNTILRSLSGAGFPLFAVAMYHNLDVDWATSLLGIVSVVLIPVPVLFFIFGARIRKSSQFSPVKN